MARVMASSSIERMSGRVGGEIVANGRSGLVLRAKPTYKRPISPLQREQMDRIATATAAWHELTREQAMAWNAWAAGSTHHNPLTGQSYKPTGFNSFVGLAAKVLQIDPQAEIPLLPPSSDFIPDRLLVSASVAAPGVVSFTATDPNSPGQSTELMVQKLVNIRRALTSRYSHLAFVSFEPGSLTVELVLAPGAYAFSFRLVEIATGRVSLPLECGVLAVS